MVVRVLGLSVIASRDAILSLYLRCMLTDREAEEIEKARRSGVGGPAVLAWIDRLLEDRRERVQQLRHVRQRLGQAFRYLDGLMTGRAPKPAAASSEPVRPCPRCGRDGSECVEIP
jgi:hypothetical protein